MNKKTQPKLFSVLFYMSIIGLILFEILKVYFIMPFPGSQTINSIQVAFFLHSNRLYFRLLFVIIIVGTSFFVFKKSHKWLPITLICLVVVVGYVFNFKMSADALFKQPQHLVFQTQLNNKVPPDRLILGVENNGEAKGYPIQFLAYHHQIQDTIGGKPILITYCNVCRTGRVFEPLINNKYEKFRLVGMDHFNAMLEDETTKSWWQQATGEAIAGKNKGTVLPQIYFQQTTVNNWYRLYPNAKIMQADPSFINKYDSLALFELGKSKGNLTKTDTMSWKPKSWVVGIIINKNSKAYDWQYLTKVRIINDTFNNSKICIALATDHKSFIAFNNPFSNDFYLRSDTLFCENDTYNFLGENLKMPSDKLMPIAAYQEFWHSWKNFQPNTIIYKSNKF
ncbi:MAG: DUF3179 domain-containing (seleno)protein [Limnohabitans sp.]|nr:DUF3179 domain-containing (seleno)protein [Limnohabitans sp.]